MATRNGSAEWRGDLQSGAGTLTVGESAFSGDYSFSSRFEEGAGTNPEELIAGAHAGCFAMALSNDLSEHGHPVESVRATARVHLRNVDGAPTIQRIELAAEGRVEASTRRISSNTPRRRRRTARCRARSPRSPRSSSQRGWSTELAHQRRNSRRRRSHSAPKSRRIPPIGLATAGSANVSPGSRLLRRQSAKSRNSRFETS